MERAEAAEPPPSPPGPLRPGAVAAAILGCSDAADTAVKARQACRGRCLNVCGRSVPPGGAGGSRFPGALR